MHEKLLLNLLLSRRDVNSNEGKFFLEGDGVYRDKIIKIKMEMNGNTA